MKRFAQSSFIRGIVVASFAGSAFLAVSSAEAQMQGVSWVGPMLGGSFFVRGVAPTSYTTMNPGNASYSILMGNAIDGGYETQNIALQNANVQGGEIIEVQTFGGPFLPASGVGAYSIYPDTYGVPWVTWPESGAQFTNVASEESNPEAYSIFGTFGTESLRPTFLSVAAGNHKTLPSDVVAVDAAGQVFIWSGGQFTRLQGGHAPPAGMKKAALFNELVSCNGETMHEPFAITTNKAIYRYQFTASTSSCTPNQNSCLDGCWVSVSNNASDITGDDFILGGGGQWVYQWDDATGSWNKIVETPPGVTFAGIGAAPAFSAAAAGVGADLTAFDTNGQLWRFATQPGFQCAGSTSQGPYTGPFYCAFNSGNPSAPSGPSNVVCTVTGIDFSSCVVN